MPEPTPNTAILQKPHAMLVKLAAERYDRALAIAEQEKQAALAVLYPEYGATGRVSFSGDGETITMSWESTPAQPEPGP